MTDLTRAELERWLPHRPPFLLLDRAENFVASRSLTGVMELPEDSPHFAGHFPGNPVLPGVLVIEAMAQTGAALSAKSENLDRTAAQLMLAIVESARFRAPVYPNATLHLDVEQLDVRHGLYRYRGEARLNGRRAGEATFSAKLVQSR